MPSQVHFREPVDGAKPGAYANGCHPLSAVKTRMLPDTEHESGQALPVNLGGYRENFVPLLYWGFYFYRGLGGTAN